MDGLLDPRVWQALIAGGVVALGWLVNGWRVRADARRERRERTRDAHKALYAEIRDVCASYWSEGEAERDAGAVLARMEAEPDFLPFVPREVHGRVFEALLPQIDVLPRQTIDAVVAFYALTASVRGMAEDMRGERFAAMAQGRRIAMFADYVALRRRAFDYGQHTLRLIAAYADGGAAAADRALARLSRPGADRSGPAGRDRA